MSTTKIWCPYAGEEMDSAACNAEHIIPLSLGGSNGFTVPVSKTLNAEVGSAIDAALATKDIITMFRRREFDARGHSNKKPEVRIRNATYGAMAQTYARHRLLLGVRMALRYGTPETGLMSPSKTSLGRPSN
ncbi:HNH endonuclease [Alcaligenes faecalis]|uniref:HNH endonuclease n=1 Tax=Alcaligenes faecalis TaxID=511 RepID=UPI00211BB1CC|nr:HNH endonuclease [Alcaligenes faecalis]UUO12074.1 HNH endonuclease [Alcaligenes faecalis]